MKKKINLYLLQRSYSIQEYLDCYINMETLEFLEEYDYYILSENEKKKCLALPKFTLNETLNFFKKYAEIHVELKNSKWYRENFNNVDEIFVMLRNYLEYESDKEPYECNEDTIWEDFEKFEEKEKEKVLVSWCKEHNIEVYYDNSQKIIDSRVNSDFDNLMDKDRLLYNKTKRKNYLIEKLKLSNDLDGIRKVEERYKEYIKYLETATFDGTKAWKRKYNEKNTGTASRE